MWQEKYSGKGLTIIGIHTPELDRERDIATVRRRAAENNLLFAIAIDNRASNWKAWNNTCWPCTYIIDKNGMIRYRWEGELNFGTTNGEEIMRKHIESLM